MTQSGNSTVINQASQKLALNWQTFNLSANESVLFNQPGRSAVALNRILDQNPSQIFGKISSNGQIFLINTHGIIFGATAQMNVGGLLASTLDLTPSDFLSGHYNLNVAGASAGIVNHGLIQAASGGSVSLVGGSVLNDGLIFANYGKINLDGADHATLDFDGNGLINIQITGELKERLDAKEAAVTNKGTLRAEDGTVVLQASATKDLFTNLVNNSGVIDASGINTDGGVVRLVGNGGNTTNSGTIDASGERGGSIQVLSDKDVLLTGGTLDASGTHGGGEVLIGGDEHGTNPLVQNAEHTQVASNVTINASATQTGDGGKVVVWSNQGTQYYGNIVTRGGDLAGNGGFVEVSGKDFLEFSGTADRLAPHGLAGTLLLDPTDLTISGTGSSSATCTAGTCTSNANTSTLKTSDLQTALASGPVNVNATAGTGGGGGTINWTGGTVAAGGHSLTLTGTSIAFNGTLTGLLDLTFTGANPTGTGSATGTGSITGIGASAFNLSGLKTGTAGGISFNGFTAADAQTITGASGFDSATKISQGMAFAAATSVTGTGSITNLGLTTFNLTGTTAGTAGGTSFSGFTAADAQTITGASGFDSATKVSEGVAFAAATSVTGTGSITGLGATAFNLTGTTAGTAGGTSFSGFTAADAQTVAGALGFNDQAKSNQGMIFANATSVTGTGAITNVVGSFADDTLKSTASLITYSTGFASVSGSGGGVTGVAGNFDLGTKVSSSSTLDYSGFNLVTVSGSGAAAAITGSGLTYVLDNTVANKGSSGSVAWTSFGNISDATGTIDFGTGGSVTGNVTAAALNYGSYGTAVTFDLSDGSGTSSGIGGTWTGVTAVTGSTSSDTINGSSQTYSLDSTFANKGGNGTVSWTSFENLSDNTAGNFVFVNGGSVSGTISGGGAGTLDYSALTTGINVGLTGPKAGSATGTGGFSGISAIKGSTSAATDTVTGLAGSDTFTLSGANAFSSSGIA
ncbi:MAG: filamentous hemagglutinin N-terminal domain-containing protein, partial [Rhodanobacter sp.]